MTEQHSKPSHPVAEVLWLAWFGNAVVAILTEWPAEAAPWLWGVEGALTSVVLGSFFVLEWFGWAMTQRKPWGGTFSEVVWFRIPHPALRWAIGAFLSIGALVMVSRLAGILLLCWLGAHFAYRTGMDLRAAKRERDRPAGPRRRSTDRRSTEE